MTEFDYWRGTLDANRVTRPSEVQVEDFTVQVEEQFTEATDGRDLPFESESVYRLQVSRSRDKQERRNRHTTESAVIEFHIEPDLAVVETDNQFPTQYALTTLDQRLDWVTFTEEIRPSTEAVWSFVDEAAAILELLVKHDGDEYPYDNVPNHQIEDVVGVKDIQRGRLQFETPVGHLNVILRPEGHLAFDATSTEQAEAVLQLYEANAIVGA